MSIFDKIQTSAPINKIAAMSADKGVQWKPIHHIAGLYKEQPDLREPSDETKKKPDFVDYTGVSIGRLVVVGIAAEIGGGGRGTSFVVRCKCGNYETRRAKSLRNMTDSHINAMCGECHHVIALRESKHWRGVKK